MIKFEQVVMNFGKNDRIEVLKGVDMEIKKGDWVSVVGPSGCGKSTLLNLAGCMLRPSAGRIVIAGMDTKALDEQDLARLRQQKIGFIFQGAYLLPALTILENVLLPSQLKQRRQKNRKQDQARAAELLRQFEMGDRLNSLPHELSYGQKRRVAIARALMNQPEILLADEPTNDLDPARAGLLVNELNALHEQGYTILMVTHSQELSAMASRQLKIDEGLLKPAI